jgi:hypothetical protein
MKNQLKKLMKSKAAPAIDHHHAKEQKRSRERAQQPQMPKEDI